MPFPTFFRTSHTQPLHVGVKPTGVAAMPMALLALATRAPFRDGYRL